MSLPVSDLVKTSQSTLTSRELLSKPVTSLLGVTAGAGTELAKLGIETVFDLASSDVFANARQLVQAAEGASTGLGRFGSVPGDLVTSAARAKKLTDLQMEPLDSLRAISTTLAGTLGPAIGATNIREFGLWPPYEASRDILSDAYGVGPADGTDPEQPKDLVPGSGLYPTERVQYDVLVLDTVDDNPPAPPLTIGNRGGVTTLGGAPGHTINTTTGSGKKLEDAGQLDLSTMALESTGFTKPATGALLTYTQSWFAEGLSLGQLLHTVALAPGESTRIAMIDWSRKTSASTKEGISTTESLTSDLSRARSISEIVSAVATEAQQGFSQSFGGGFGTSTGTASGGAGSADLTSMVGLPLKVAGGSGESTGMGFGVSGSQSSAWTTGQRNLSANMAQNVMDRTQQASNSARNQWATIVREVSQSESENISTRTVTNYNHMHALSVEYFEIVQLYRVAVELTKVTGCLFVPMKLIDFTKAGVVARYKRIIAAVGLTTQVQALQFAETDTIVLSSPYRKGDWGAGGIIGMFGEPVGDPAGSTLALPLNFYPTFLAYYDPAPFSSFVLEFSNGTTKEIPVTQNGSPNIGSSYVELDIDYGTTMDKAATFWDVVSIRAKKKQGSEDWTGDVKIYFRMASLQREGFPKPQNGLTYSFLMVQMTIPASDPSPVLFEMERTVSGRDLRQHLMDNQLYYSQTIWRTLDSATIAQLLSGYTFEGKPVLSQVDPLPVTVAGNFLVFRRHLTNSTMSEADWEKWLEARDIKVGERTDDLVPLPSGGVFAEAVLGRFNSAEKLDITRFWNWQDSPIPITPPEIAAIQSGSRAQPEDLMPSQMSQPVLNLQVPPNEPDPQGLTAILQAIQNGNMFRDMSGLNSTIGFAQTALTRAFDAARDAASQAGENMKTAADIYKSAFGGQGGDTAKGATSNKALANQTAGISGQGAKINQGKDMDSRGVQKNGNGNANPGNNNSNGTNNSPKVIPASYEAMAFNAATGEDDGSGGDSSQDSEDGSSGDTSLVPLITFSPNRPSAAANRAFARMAAQDAVQVATKMDTYINTFGFDRTQPQVIRGESIREPWTGMLPKDLEAILAVANTLGVKPSHVAAVWISEGKLVFNNILQDETNTESFEWTKPSDFRASTMSDWLSFTRSRILFEVFGCDPLIAMSPRAAGGENLLLGPRSDHDTPFDNGLDEIRGNGIASFGGTTDEVIREFFTTQGAGFNARFSRVGSNEIITVSLPEESIASWLWLQAGLFQDARVKMEKELKNLYPGGDVDLSNRPWVTYVFWNSNQETASVTKFFSGAASAEDAIARRFGGPGRAPDKLSQDQLTRYYADPQSGAALANGILIKWLVEVIDPWFA